MFRSARCVVAAAATLPVLLGPLAPVAHADDVDPHDISVIGQGTDTDDDMLADWYEWKYAGDLTTMTYYGDNDNDGAVNAYELQNGTDGMVQDTDSDGIDDGDDIALFYKGVSNGWFTQDQINNSYRSPADINENGVRDGDENWDELGPYACPACLAGVSGRRVALTAEADNEDKDDAQEFCFQDDQDADHDGIADEDEDDFGDAIHKADSDEDGILDGNDDANRNGIADEDEDDAGNAKDLCQDGIHVEDRDDPSVTVKATAGKTVTLAGRITHVAKGSKLTNTRSGSKAATTQKIGNGAWSAKVTAPAKPGKYAFTVTITNGTVKAAATARTTMRVKR